MQTGADDQDVGPVRTYKLMNVARIGRGTDYVKDVISRDGVREKFAVNSAIVRNKYSNGTNWLGRAQFLQNPSKTSLW